MAQRLGLHRVGSQGPLTGFERAHDTVRFMVYQGGSVMGEASVGRGGGSPVGSGCGALVIQTGVMRAVAMIMEKKAHPKNPWSTLPQAAQGSVERALHAESHLLFPRSLYLPSGSIQTSPPQRGCPRPSCQSGCLSFSPSQPP